MYNYAFFARILAIASFLFVLLVCLPVSVLHFRLRSRVEQAQESIQNAYRAQVTMSSLIPNLVQYSRQDPSILPLLNKYGIAPVQPAEAQPPAKKAGKK
jgi:hypothetical protein